MSSTTTVSSNELSQRLDPIVQRYQGKKGITIPLLADVQKEYGYVAEEAVTYVSKKMDISASEMFGVATFYAMFRLQPEGKYVIRICRGTACHVQGSASVAEEVARHLGIEEGETTEDGIFTLQHVACLGCCSLAPVMMVGDNVHGLLTPPKSIEILEDYRKKG
jgi:NADH-quinone oxidoreductase subunit E